MENPNVREERAPAVSTPSKKVTMVAKQPAADEVNTIFLVLSIEQKKCLTNYKLKWIDDTANSISNFSSHSFHFKEIPPNVYDIFFSFGIE